VAALSSIALGSLLFVQVGKSATAKAYNLTTLARFHSEAMALFYRAQGITDDKQTPQLETELNTWQGGVSEWLQAHLPIYAPRFLEAARKNTIFYRHTEGETVPGDRVPYRKMQPLVRDQLGVRQGRAAPVSGVGVRKVEVRAGGPSRLRHQARPPG
jgi:hypothetical protein